MADKTVDLDKLKLLADFSQSETWATLKQMLHNRKEKDKNAIITFPEVDPVRLAVQKSFYRGRISAIEFLVREIETASHDLDMMEEKRESKK